MADSHRLLIRDHRDLKGFHQRAQLSGVSPQSRRRARVAVVCDVWGEEMKRSVLLLSARTSRLHVQFIIFFLNQHI